MNSTTFTSAIADQRFAGLGLAVNEVDRAGGEAGLLEQLGEALADGRRVLGGLEDDGVAFEQAGPEHPQRHGEGEVPRRDDGDDAPRLAAHEGVLLGDLRGQHLADGHPAGPRSIEGLHMIQYVFGTGRMPIGEVLASEIAEKDAFMRRKPWGVVAVITPWNFPFAVPLWMLGPSLLEGNTAVFKPSEDTPAIGQRLVELFEEAGFPPGVINLVHGDGEAGEALVREPRRQRRAVHRQLRRRPAHPAVVGRALRPHRRRRDGQQERGHRLRGRPARPGGDLRASSARFKTSGQRCVSAGRILVARERCSTASPRSSSATAKRLRIGDPLDAGNFTGPVIHRGAVEKVLGYNDLARKEGAKVLLDGGRHDRRRARRRLLPVAVRLPHGASARACAASARRCSARTWP